MAGAKDKDNEPEIIGPYTLARKLGQGHFAKVRLGEDKYKNKVAIKIFDKVTILAQASTNSYSLAHIERELNALRLCSPHPHIASMNEVLETDTHVYFVMEYVSGGELYDYIVSEGRIEEGEACRLFYQLVHAVNYCHSKEIAHRDLKPENILLDTKLNVRIVDFGLASWPGENYKRTEGQSEYMLKTQCGSPEYAAPEVLRASSKNSIGYRGSCADVWSLGVVLYAMLVGSLPFTAPNVRMVIENILHGAFVLPSHLSPAAQLLLKHMLIVDPTRRATLKQVLEHAWIRQRSASFPQIIVRDDKPLGNQRLTVSKASREQMHHMPVLGDIDEMDSLTEERLKGLNLGGGLGRKETQQVWGRDSDDEEDDFVDDTPSVQEVKSESKEVSRQTQAQKEAAAAKKAMDQQMFKAAESGDVEAMKKLVVHELVDLRHRSIDNFTPLHFACRKAHLEVVRVLLTSVKPLSVDAMTKSGWTPLMMAADQGHKDICQLLIQYGANIHLKNDNGKSAIFLARERNHSDIAQLLTTASSNRTKKATVPSLQFQFFAAAEDGDLNQMRHLVSLSKQLLAAAPTTNDVEAVAQRKHAKVSITASGIDNWTVLHFAARKGHLAVCQQMLAALPKRMIDAQTKSGWTPLMMAADKGYMECVELLVRQKASLDVRNVQGGNVLDVAKATSADDKDKVIKYLLSVRPSA